MYLVLSKDGTLDVMPLPVFDEGVGAFVGGDGGGDDIESFDHGF
jgi:hypothetical protein